MSIDRWIDKEMWDIYIYISIYIYNEILFNHIKKEILSYAKIWVNLEDIMLTEISQSQKDRYWMLPPTWGIQSQTHRSRK